MHKIICKSYFKSAIQSSVSGIDKNLPVRFATRASPWSSCVSAILDKFKMTLFITMSCHSLSTNNSRDTLDSIFLRFSKTILNIYVVSEVEIKSLLFHLFARASFQPGQKGFF